MSPRVLGTLRMNLRFLAYLLPLAIVAGTVLHAEVWYLCCCVILLRLCMSVPYWRYRDKFPAFPASGGTSFMAGKAATMGSAVNLTSKL